MKKYKWYIIGGVIAATAVVIGVIGYNKGWFGSKKPASSTTQAPDITGK